MDARVGCSRKACPYPADGPDGLCRPHRLQEHNPEVFGREAAGRDEGLPDLPDGRGKGQHIRWTPELLAELHEAWTAWGRGDKGQALRAMAERMGTRIEVLRSRISGLGWSAQVQ